MTERRIAFGRTSIFERGPLRPVKDPAEVLRTARRKLGRPIRYTRLDNRSVIYRFSHCGCDLFSTVTGPPGTLDKFTGSTTAFTRL